MKNRVVKKEKKQVTNSLSKILPDIFAFIPLEQLKYGKFLYFELTIKMEHRTVLKKINILKTKTNYRFFHA